MAPTSRLAADRINSAVVELLRSGPIEREGTIAATVCRHHHWPADESSRRAVELSLGRLHRSGRCALVLLPPDVFGSRPFCLSDIGTAVSVDLASRHRRSSIAAVERLQVVFRTQFGQGSTELEWACRIVLVLNAGPFTGSITKLAQAAQIKEPRLNSNRLGQVRRTLERGGFLLKFLPDHRGVYQLHPDVSPSKAELITLCRLARWSQATD